MLARLAREIPIGPYTYEPKWDGFRCLAFVDGRGVDLRSRHDRPLARYFPEVVEALEAMRDDAADGPGRAFVLDGELVIADDRVTGDDPGGRPRDLAADDAFSRLMSRLHPAASRVDRLRAETPARYVAFDALSIDATDLSARPYPERRRILEEIVPAGGTSVGITPVTRDVAVAERWLTAFPNVDGVVAKADDLPYAPGKRAMVKVKLLRTADCVVAGLRLFGDGLVSSLLLGLYDREDRLRHVGVVTQLGRADRAALARDLAPLAVSLQAHPWRDGFIIGASPLGRLKGSASRWTPDMEHDWLPLRPERVVEVGFDRVDGDRFRHPARLLRWRPDRSPESCRIDQLDTRAAGVPVAGERVPGVS
jgi:ATP-dependent DNA ligase